MVPRLSVIIPAHNEEQFLPSTIAAVQLAGSRWREGGNGEPDYEIIVVDNDSTDRTAAVARHCGAKVVHESVRGIARARNAGAAAARGSFLLFVDADTRIQPNLIEEVCRVLSAGSVWGGSVNLRQDSGRPGWALNFFICNVLAHVVNIRGGVFYCTSEAFARVRGFDETLPSLEDVRFFHQLRRLGRARGRRFKHISTTYALTSARRLDGKVRQFFTENGLELIISFIRAILPPPQVQQ